MIQFKARTWFFLGCLSCFSMLAVGAYFQIVEEMEPCPLCISQRIAILTTGIIFLIAALHNPAQKGTRCYAIIGSISALFGSAISARHVWLQNLPPEEVPECSPGLSYIFENFPLTETLKLMLNGTGECADVLWNFLGLSIPGWTFVAFIGLASLSLYQLFNKA
ncbi:MAG: disulfide bond formation protein DsbB [Methyloprofundus sp.]|nr:MAG: disulfide bond formation protein DsbB [Methyloprofundus sp.]